MLLRLWYIFLLTALWSCQTSEPSPTAEKGQIDLSSYNFAQQNVLLDGEWEFYWEKLYTPKDFTKDIAIKPHFQTVPGSWTSLPNPPKDFSAYGYATYRLQIKLPVCSEDIGLFIPKIWSSAKVWANSKLIYETGKVDTSRQSYQNNILEKMVMLSDRPETLELVVQVASFEIFIAGLVQSFHIGYYERLFNRTEINYSWTLMWLGGLFLMGLYHFVLFAFRRKSHSTLYVGLIALLIALRLTVFGDHYLYDFLKEQTHLLSFAVQSKVYYITTFLLIPIGLLYINSLFKDKLKPIIWQSAWGITAIYCLFILVFPPYVFTQTILYYQPIVGIYVLTLIWAILHAAWQRARESGLQLVGIGILILGGINDGLHQQGIELLGSFEILPLSFAIFLFLQFVIIARRFSRAFAEVEDLSLNLEQKVKTRTADLAKANQELGQAYQNIRDSVQYASRIQKALLGKSESITQLIPQSFILFRPKDIVSGDFYWFTECKQTDKTVKIVVAADCTGHGVPGAFMTIMGNDLLDEIVLQKSLRDPAEILEALAESVEKRLSREGEGSISDGMDLGLMIINETDRKIGFAGAKNPLYWVSNDKIKVVNASKRSIGYNLYSEPFKTQWLDYQPGDSFYMASDGYQDQFGGENGRKFMKKRFRELLFEISTLTTNQQLNELSSKLNQWQGDIPQTDDILVVGMQL